MLFKICILTAAILIVCSRCSNVIDVHKQRGVYISDYCPTIGECGEGSHVMCLYNQMYCEPTKRVMGPTCTDYLEDMQFTPEYAYVVLQILNRIRSKVANGQVIRKKGQKLPRGYGILRVVWDEELATFAQVWANQCLLRIDMCRASKRFPDPGQALGLIRFSMTDWMPIHDHNFTSDTLTPDKVRYAIATVIKAWWEQKDYTSSKFVKTGVDPKVDDVNNKFINLIYGPLTHVGCGISVYKEYAYKDNNAALNFNAVQIVCNFSARPKNGQPLYTVDPPTKPGYTVRCGCPEGYDEDDHCLCYETGRKFPYSCKNNDQCKPSVVILPIFTVEDAPSYRIGNKTTPALRETTNEIFDRFDTLNDRIPVHNYNDIFDDLEYCDSDLRRHFPADVKKRYFNNTHKVSRMHSSTKVPYRLVGVTQARRHLSGQKHSIFAKSGIFALPIKKRKQMTMNVVHHVKQFKKDVAPRKDFSKVQLLVSSYLDKKRNGKSFDLNLDSDGYLSHGSILNSDHKNTSTDIKKNKDVDYKYSNQKVVNANSDTINGQFKNTNFNLPNEKGDRKLMYLLNKLEQEVKNVDLNTNEKGMFDEKIRKIYGTLVGKPDLNEQKYKLLRNPVNTTLTNNIDLNRLTQVDQIYMDKNGLDSNKPSDNYRNFQNEKSVTEYENKLPRSYSKDDVNNDFKNIFPRGIHENVGKRRFRNMYDVRALERDNSDYKNRHSRTEGDEYYPLNSERRRYYHEKLANLQKKINNMKLTDRKEIIPEDRQMRPVRPTKLENHRRRSSDQVNTFYMPDRARFLHGF